MDNQGATGADSELPVTKQLINLTDGSIKIENIYGRGSTFTILLPLERDDTVYIELRTGTSPHVSAKL
jgi:signal transduction histidine kinase